MPRSVERETTTIVVPRDLKTELDLLKVHPRETYAEIIRRLIDCSYDTEPLSPETIQAIEDGLDAIKRGETYSLDEVMREIGVE